MIENDRGDVQNPASHTYSPPKVAALPKISGPPPRLCLVRFGIWGFRITFRFLSLGSGFFGVGFCVSLWAFKCLGFRVHNLLVRRLL